VKEENTMADLENKNTKATEKAEKVEKKPKKEKVKLSTRIATAFRGYKSEVKKIVWPTGKQTFKNLLVVLVVIILSALLIALLDYAFANGMTALTKLFSK
jgi:preprotein translocase subunit SecE